VSESELHIDRPAEADLLELRRLFEVTIRDTFHREGIDVSHAEDIEREISDRTAALARDIATDGTAACFLIARWDTIIAGTIAIGRPNLIIRSHLNIALESVPEIHSAYVLPEYQGRGIGSRLFEAMRQRLRDRQVQSFCLDCGYRAAQRFWSRRLGEPSLVLHDYFGPGAHHMIWHRSIDDILPEA
jgi:GNAT superfamily N-acetyltransferase